MLGGVFTDHAIYAENTTRHIDSVLAPTSYGCICFSSTKAVVPKLGGTALLGEVRNSRGAVKQKWAVGGR